MMGFSNLQWTDLRHALQAHPLVNPVMNTLQKPPYGTLFEVRCTLQSPNGRNPCIRPIWTIEPQVSPDPRVVSAYPYP
jgi:hypothetical protein